MVKNDKGGDVETINLSIAQTSTWILLGYKSNLIDPTILTMREDMAWLQRSRLELVANEEHVAMYRTYGLSRHGTIWCCPSSSPPLRAVVCSAAPSLCCQEESLQARGTDVMPEEPGQCPVESFRTRWTVLRTVESGRAYANTLRQPASNPSLCFLTFLCKSGIRVLVRGTYFHRRSQQSHTSVLGNDKITQVFARNRQHHLTKITRSVLDLVYYGNRYMRQAHSLHKPVQSLEHGGAHEILTAREGNDCAPVLADELTIAGSMIPELVILPIVPKLIAVSKQNQHTT